MSVKHLKIETYEDDYGTTCRQDVVDEDGTCLYSVWNLGDCPEDAILGRSLFSGHEWIDAVRYGMELARRGYGSIEVKETRGDHEW